MLIPGTGIEALKPPTLGKSLYTVNVRIQRHQRDIFDVNGVKTTHRVYKSIKIYGFKTCGVQQKFVPQTWSCTINASKRLRK